MWRARKLPQNTSPAPVASTGAQGCGATRSRPSGVASSAPCEPIFSTTRRGPQPQVEVGDRVRIGEAGEGGGIVEAGKRDVCLAQGLVDHPGGTAAGGHSLGR